MLTLKEHYQKALKEKNEKELKTYERRDKSVEVRNRKI